MKKIYLFLFLPTLILSCDNDKKTADATPETVIQNDHNWMQLKGKVKQITKTVYFSAAEKFDDWFPADSQLRHIFIYDFNNDGFITTATRIIPASNDTIVTQYLLANGKATGFRLFKSGQPIDSVKIEWQNDSTNIESGYDAKRHVKTETRSKYNGYAHLVETEDVTTNDSGLITERVITRYIYPDPKGYYTDLVSVYPLTGKTDTATYKIITKDAKDNITKKVLLRNGKEALALVYLSYVYY